MPSIATISPNGQPIEFSPDGEQIVKVSSFEYDPEFTGSIIGDSFQQYVLGNVEYKQLDRGNGFSSPWDIKPWPEDLVMEDTFESYDTGSFINGANGGTFTDKEWGYPWKVIQY